MQHHLLPPHLNGWLAFYIHKDKLKCSLVTRHFASTCWMLKQLSLRNGWLTRVSSHRHCSHNYDQDRIGVKICFLCVSKTNFYDVIYNLSQKKESHTSSSSYWCGCHAIVCFSVCFRPVLRVVVYSWPLTGLCGMTKTRRCVHVCVCACICACTCVHMLGAYACVHMFSCAYAYVYICEHVCMASVFPKYTDKCIHKSSLSLYTCSYKYIYEQSWMYTEYTFSPHP